MCTLFFWDLVTLDFGLVSVCDAEAASASMDHGHTPCETHAALDCYQYHRWNGRYGSGIRCNFSSTTTTQARQYSCAAEMRDVGTPAVNSTEQSITRGSGWPHADAKKPRGERGP